MEAFFNGVVAAFSPEVSIQVENEALKMQLCAQDQKLLAVLDREEELQSKCARLIEQKLYAVARMELAERKLADCEKSREEDLKELIRFRDEAVTMSSKIDDLERMLADDEETIETLEGRNSALAGALEEADDEVCFLKERVEHMKRELERTVEQKTSAEKLNDEQKSKIGCMEIKMEQLELQKSEAEAKFEALMAKNPTPDQDLKTQVVFLRQQLDAAQKTIEELESRISSLSRELENEHDRSDYYKDQTEWKENELQAALDREDLFRARCDELDEAECTASEELERYRDRSTELGKRLYAAETKLKVTVEECEAFKEENCGLKKKIDMMSTSYHSRFGGERFDGFSTFF